MNAGVEDVFDPWWGTSMRSERSAAASRRSISASLRASTSAVRRIEAPAVATRSTQPRSFSLRFAASAYIDAGGCRTVYVTPSHRQLSPATQARERANAARNFTSGGTDVMSHAEGRAWAIDAAPPE